MADEKKTYNGACHCGAVKFTVLYKPLEETGVTLCNCSFCTLQGVLSIQAPMANFEIQEGEESLKDYVWGNKRMTWKFCSNCGTCCYGAVESHKIVAVNARTLKDVDIDSLRMKPFDGKNKM